MTSNSRPSYKERMTRIAFLLPVLCLCIAGILAFNGSEGWGWFLFAALLLCPSGSVSNEEESG